MISSLPAKRIYIHPIAIHSFDDSRINSIMYEKNTAINRSSRMQLTLSKTFLGKQEKNGTVISTSKYSIGHATIKKIYLERLRKWCYIDSGNSAKFNCFAKLCRFYFKMSADSEVILIFEK